jgi:hypothetical protein
MSAYREHAMQTTLAVFLGRALPSEVAWTSVDPATDQHMDDAAGRRRKDRGIKPGWPDVQFIYQGRFYGIELKIGDGKQSDYQAQRQAEIERAGGVYVICRSVEEVERQLRAWGFPMRATTMAAHAYDERREFRLTAPKKPTKPRRPRVQASRKGLAIMAKMYRPPSER